MTVLVDTVNKTYVPLDDALPARGMDKQSFEEVSDLPPPIPDRIALLRVSPVGEVVYDVGMNRGGGVFYVCEM